MADEEKKEEARSEVEILANALADSNKEANSSNKNTVRVLGTLLAFSVLGNFALAGLNISGKFFGTDINMGAEHPAYFPEDMGHWEEGMMMPEDIEGPPEDVCVEWIQSGEAHPDDIAWCADLYPWLFEE